MAAHLTVQYLSKIRLQISPTNLLSPTLPLSRGLSLIKSTSHQIPPSIRSRPFLGFYSLMFRRSSNIKMIPLEKLLFLFFFPFPYFLVCVCVCFFLFSVLHFPVRYDAQSKPVLFFTSELSAKFNTLIHLTPLSPSSEILVLSVGKELFYAWLKQNDWW
jgi:hypothetical protein